MTPILLLTGLLLVSPVKFVSSEISADGQDNHTKDGWGGWSEWGACSLPCDGGVTRQTRDCHSEHGCPGLAVRRKMCNMQACVNASDPRAAQCSAYDGRPYSDGAGAGAHTWEPHADPSAPCALTCRARDSQLVAKLAQRVIDGTRCRDGSLDICVDGQCQVLGCDLEIGSRAVVDACGVCGGDGASCVAGDHFWVERVAAACSVSCGGGFQVSRAVCRSRRGGVDVSDEFCDFRLRPRDRLVECGQLPCQASWSAGPWGDCSASCDGGQKLRRVRCTETANATVVQVHESRCSDEKPATTEPCNFVSCPKWYQGPWSECSTTCGDGGEQTRAVFCRDARGHLSRACPPDLKPPGRRACPQRMACPLSQVKHTQELPYQLPLAHAHTEPRYPAAVQSSRDLAPSTEPRFVADAWSECSVTCGEGLRRRQVECKVFLEFSQTLVSLPNRECGRNRPAQLERCILPSCPQVHNSVMFPDDTTSSHPGTSYHQPLRQVQQDDDRSGKQPRHIFDSLYDVNDPQDHVHNPDIGVYSPEMMLNGVDDEYSNSEGLGGGDYGLSDHHQSDWRADDTHEVSWPLETHLGSDLQQHDDQHSASRQEHDDTFFSAGVNTLNHAEDHHHDADRGPPSEDFFPEQVETTDAAEHPPSPSHKDGIHRLRSHVLSGGRRYQDVVGSFDLLGGRPAPGTRSRHPAELEGGVVVIRPTSPPAHKQPEPEQEQYVWRKAGFTPCSSSCLGGVQESLVQCIQMSDGAEASPFRCRLDTRPDTVTRTCNDIPCPPRWNVTDFGECSHRCGKGTQQRGVQCVHELARGSDNTLVVDDDQCGRQKPAAEQLCNMVDCPPRWTPGPWSQCSRSCGGGVKHRVLRCQQRMADGTMVDKAPSMCGPERPADRRSCNRRRCRAPQVVVSRQTYEQESIQKRVTLKIGGTAAVYKGTTVKLKCPVRQFDRSKIVWTKNGNRLAPDERRKYHLRSNGQLTVRQVEFRDAGRYTCIAGSAMGSLDLSVKPSPIGELPWIREQRLRKERKKKQREERRRRKQRRRKQQLEAASTMRPHYGLQTEMSNAIGEPADGLPAPSDGVVSPDGEQDNSLDSLRRTFVSDQQSPPPGRDPQGLVLGNNRGRGRSRFRRPPIAEQKTTTTHKPAVPETAVDGASVEAKVSTDDDVLKLRTDDAQLKGVTDDLSGLVVEDINRFHGDTVEKDTSLGSSSDVDPAKDFQSGSETQGGSTAYTPEEHSGKHEVPAYSSRQDAGDDGEIQLLGKGDPWQVRFEWLITDWSPCSQTCGSGSGSGSGGGLQVRAAQCLVRLENATETVSAALCEDAGLPRPSTLRPCGQRPCPAWHAAPWRPCRKSRCVQWNYAMQRRRVSCRLPNGTAVEPAQCRRRLRPPARQECYNDQCRGLWRVGPWSGCSARACATAGYQSRILRCVWFGTTRAAGNSCRDQPRPTVVRSCQGPPCPENLPSDSGANMAQHDEGCSDRASYCVRARKLALCSMQRIRTDCCRTCRDLG